MTSRQNCGSKKQQTWTWNRNEAVFRTYWTCSLNNPRTRPLFLGGTLKFPWILCFLTSNFKPAWICRNCRWFQAFTKKIAPNCSLTIPYPRLSQTWDGQHALSAICGLSPSLMKECMGSGLSPSSAVARLFVVRAWVAGGFRLTQPLKQSSCKLKFKYFPRTERGHASKVQEHLGSTLTN